MLHWIVFEVARRVMNFFARLVSAGSLQREWTLTPAFLRRSVAARMVSAGTLNGMSREALVRGLGRAAKTNWGPSKWSLMWYLGPRNSGGEGMFKYQEYLAVELNIPTAR